MKDWRRVALGTLVSAVGLVGACTGRGTTRLEPSGDPPALDAIRQEDLRRDLFVLASQAMRGREAGTVDEMRASGWLAEQARQAGLEPMGDDGTYFQFWPMRRTRVSDDSRIEVSGSVLSIPEDAVLLYPTAARLDAPIVFVGLGKDADLAGVDLRGRIAAAELSHPEGAAPLGPDLSPRRYTMSSVRQRAQFLIDKGAAGVILVSDTVADGQFQNIATGWARGSYAIDDGGPPASTRPPVVWVRRRSLRLVRQPGARLVADIGRESFVVPSVNVVARAPGSDPARRDEVVLFSAHQDGLGVRYAWDGDSIWTGADDNATTSVALLAIGRAWVQRPAARSALFVWHGAEEVGLLGSSYHAANPVVPLDRIVAVLNGDMIGRNHPDTAALLGSQPPNRNAPALVDMALAANARVSRFVVDSSWDRPDHPENFFRRSDHWPYARRDVPVVYFSALLHGDYHTPRDDPEGIDYGKLTRMARWMYATGWAAGSAP
ncbi:MAG TPA: M28 family peptidase [Gemmatimonadaceae bacterium]|nr:M28 family peptidase [Gemmatimonadaceae bacterium]